ncbi:hypothetical protein Tco_0586787 [Tanacetum coccineum]
MRIDRTDVIFRVPSQPTMMELNSSRPNSRFPVEEEIAVKVDTPIDLIVQQLVAFIHLILKKDTTVACEMLKQGNFKCCVAYAFICPVVSGYGKSYGEIVPYLIVSVLHTESVIFSSCIDKSSEDCSECSDSGSDLASKSQQPVSLVLGSANSEECPSMIGILKIDICGREQSWEGVDVYFLVYKLIPKITSVILKILSREGHRTRNDFPVFYHMRTRSPAYYASPVYMKPLGRLFNEFVIQVSQGLVQPETSCNIQNIDLVWVFLTRARGLHHHLLLLPYFLRSFQTHSLAMFEIRIITFLGEEYFFLLILHQLLYNKKLLKVGFPPFSLSVEACALKVIFLSVEELAWIVDCGVLVCPSFWELARFVACLHACNFLEEFHGIRSNHFSNVGNKKRIVERLQLSGDRDLPFQTLQLSRL